MSVENFQILNNLELKSLHSMLYDMISYDIIIIKAENYEILANNNSNV